jgi:hypothetical protein
MRFVDLAVHASSGSISRCLHCTRLELVAERKVRRRQLTDDGNVEITGRDLRERESRAHNRRPCGYDRAAS